MTHIKKTKHNCSTDGNRLWFSLYYTEINFLSNSFAEWVLVKGKCCRKVDVLPEWTVRGVKSSECVERKDG